MRYIWLAIIMVILSIWRLKQSGWFICLIGGSLRCKDSTGKIEAKNPHIKTMKRVSYEFKSFENMRIWIFLINQCMITKIWARMWFILTQIWFCTTHQSFLTKSLNFQLPLSINTKCRKVQITWVHYGI